MPETKGFDAFVTARFNWTAKLNAVWAEPKFDVNGVHAHVVDEIMAAVDERGTWTDDGVLGQLIIGEAGSGKTHLLGRLRARVVGSGGTFILGDMTDVRDFWQTLNQSFVNSLTRVLPDGSRQIARVIASLFPVFRHPGGPEADERELRQLKPSTLSMRVNQMASYAAEQGRLPPQHLDVFKAVLLAGSDRPEVAVLGEGWLLGLDVSGNGLLLDELSSEHPSERERVRSLSWILAHHGPVVVAFDQLDSLISEARAAKDGATTARSILEHVTNGLSATYDVIHRGVTVVSVLESNWRHLLESTVSSVGDRFAFPQTLEQVSSPELEAMVEQRLSAHYAEVGFEPPYPSWPIHPSAFGPKLKLTPRRLLQRLDELRRQARVHRSVSETHSLTEQPTTADLVLDPSEGLLEDRDDRFARLCAEVDAKAIAEASDRELDALLEAACLALVLEVPRPAHEDVEVDLDFGRGGQIEPLHVRVRVIDHDADDREKHFSLRFIQHSHHTAFLARMRKALTESGIGADIEFRRLSIFRTEPVPSGPVTKETMASFESDGGTLVKPSAEELVKLEALSKAVRTWDQDSLEAWLRSRKLVSRMACFKELVDFCFTHEEEPPQTPKAESTPPGSTGSVHQSEVAEPVDAVEAEPGSILVLGKEVGADADVGVRVDELPRHAAVLAAAGSGKTVFVRTIVEEAALLGIPSMVIDVANDLVTFGVRPTDRETDPRAQAFFDRSETVVWTPGWVGGNAFFIDALPDLSPLKGDTDTLNEAVSLVLEAWRKDLKLPKTQKGEAQAAVLRRAIMHCAERGLSGPSALAEVLAAAPQQIVADLPNAAKVAEGLAGGIRSRIELDTLLRPDGVPLDFEELLSGSPGRARISVISLAGLATLETKQSFVGRFCTMLFTHLHRHPGAAGQVKGLLVIDEAKDFVPSGGKPSSSAPILRLAAQARKYGLGMIIATQEPRSIDHHVVANAGTQVVGRTLSTAAQDAAKQMLHQLGWTGSTKLAALAQGEFIFSAPSGRPAKLRGRMCYSDHSGPRTPEQVKAMARESRSQHLGGR